MITMPLLLREVRGVDSIKAFAVNLLTPYDPDMADAEQQQVRSDAAGGDAKEAS